MITVVRTSYHPLIRVMCTAEPNNAVIFGSLPTNAGAQSNNQ